MTTQESKDAAPGGRLPEAYFSTSLGSAYLGDSHVLLKDLDSGSVNLAMTSARASMADLRAK